MPNRLYGLSATIDPDGKDGGPVVETPGFDNAAAAVGSVRWETMFERLSDADVSWKVYQPPGTSAGPGQDSALALGFNALLYFEQYVSDGQILSTLVSNPEVWAKTVVLFMYDENGGFFDHVPPPTAPPGTPGEELTVRPLPKDADGVASPIGLGFRVPAMVISPFSRGGYVCSDTFDHTSLLRFLETRYGVKVPNLSAWRRTTCGDLTSALDFAGADTGSRSCSRRAAPPSSRCRTSVRRASTRPRCSTRHPRSCRRRVSACHARSAGPAGVAAEVGQPMRTFGRGSPAASQSA